MLAHLRTTNVLLPAAAVLERIGLSARVRARRKTFEALADDLTDAECEALESLLTVDPEVHRSRFAWLRDYSELPAPSNSSSLCSTGSNTRAALGLVPSARDEFMPPASVDWSMKARS